MQHKIWVVGRLIGDYDEIMETAVNLLAESSHSWNKILRLLGNGNSDDDNVILR